MAFCLYTDLPYIPLNFLTPLGLAASPSNLIFSNMMLAVLTSFSVSLSPLMAFLSSVTSGATGIPPGGFADELPFPFETLVAPAGGGAGPDDDEDDASISDAGGFLGFSCPCILTPEVETSLLVANAVPSPTSCSSCVALLLLVLEHPLSLSLLPFLFLFCSS